VTVQWRCTPAYIWLSRSAELTTVSESDQLLVSTMTSLTVCLCQFSACRRSFIVRRLLCLQLK